MSCYVPVTYGCLSDLMDIRHYPFTLCAFIKPYFGPKLPVFRCFRAWPHIICLSNTPEINVFGGLPYLSTLAHAWLHKDDTTSSILLTWHAFMLVGTMSNKHRFSLKHRSCLCTNLCAWICAYPCSCARANRLASFPSTSGCQGTCTSANFVQENLRQNERQVDITYEMDQSEADRLSECALGNMKTTQCCDVQVWAFFAHSEQHHTAVCMWHLNTSPVKLLQGL